MKQSLLSFALRGFCQASAFTSVTLFSFFAVSTGRAATGTIADVKHVVIFMQENRSFDHYFGCLAGVRGFNDATALQMQNGQIDFYQPNGSSAYVLPYHTSAMNLVDIDHAWASSHNAWNNGSMNGWVSAKGAASLMYYNRSDIPFHYALADAYTICDAYFCSTMSSTNPNRLHLFTGMIDANGTWRRPHY